MNTKAVNMTFIYLSSRGKISHSEFPTSSYYPCILFLKKRSHFCRIKGMLAFIGSWEKNSVRTGRYDWTIAIEDKEPSARAMQIGQKVQARRNVHSCDKMTVSCDLKKRFITSIRAHKRI